MASELLWELVPPLVLAADDFVLAALLEPCYDIGGDAFDYALNDGVLHLAVFDGMGHGLAAAGVTAFALSAYRHSRRSGARAGGHLRRRRPARCSTSTRPQPLRDRADRRARSLLRQCCTGSAPGHPAPLLLRDGRLDQGTRPPAGPAARHSSSPRPRRPRAEESLEPGDMILLYTDGLSEARRPGGELFTVERLGEFIERRPPAESPRPRRCAVCARRSSTARRRAARRRHRATRGMASRRRTQAVARHRLNESSRGIESVNTRLHRSCEATSRRAPPGHAPSGDLTDSFSPQRRKSRPPIEQAGAATGDCSRERALSHARTTSSTLVPLLPGTDGPPGRRVLALRRPVGDRGRAADDAARDRRRTDSDAAELARAAARVRPATRTTRAASPAQSWELRSAPSAPAGDDMNSVIHKSSRVPSPKSSERPGRNGRSREQRRGRRARTMRAERPAGLRVQAAALAVGQSSAGTSTASCAEP